MTKAQLIRKTKECIKTDKAFIDKLINKAVESGCMDISGAENNYQLPKNLLSAIYREMSRQYAPLDGNRGQKKNVNNIYIHL